MDCAVRETLEECGYDATGRLREKDSFTIVQNAKRITLYIVKNVPEDFEFKPRVRTRSKRDLPSTCGKAGPLCLSSIVALMTMTRCARR